MEASAAVVPPGNTGPLGNRRGIGFGILLFIVTIGFYGLYWAFKTQEEMKQHTGEGLGGVLGLVIWILLEPVSAFVIPSEIGKMYEKDGGQPPVNGWTGLWLFPFGDLHHPGDRLVREGPGRAERLLGGEGRSRSLAERRQRAAEEARAGQRRSATAARRRA